MEHVNAMQKDNMKKELMALLEKWDREQTA
jgi:hypothetical protein